MAVPPRRVQPKINPNGYVTRPEDIYVPPTGLPVDLNAPPNLNLQDQEAWKDFNTEQTGVAQQPPLYIDPQRKLEYYRTMLTSPEISESQRAYYKQLIQETIAEGDQQRQRLIKMYQQQQQLLDPNHPANVLGVR